MNNFLLELNNLDERNNFLKGHKLLKPSQEEIKHPKQSYISLRNNSYFKNFPQRKHQAQKTSLVFTGL